MAGVLKRLVCSIGAHELVHTGWSNGWIVQLECRCCKRKYVSVKTLPAVKEPRNSCWSTFTKSLLGRPWRNGHF